MQHARRLASVFITLIALATGVPRAVERPQPASPVRDYVHTVQVGPAARYRNLVIYPLLSGRAWHPNVLSLDEAVRSHELIVGEIGEGEVNDLSVENVGKQAVYIMAGEILEGAKQTRVLQSDVLVPPHSGRLHIGAFCVEHGRWSYQNSEDKDFKSGGLISNPAVRAQAQISKSQGDVWNEVEATHRKLAVPSTTGALTEAYRAPKVQEDVGPYIRNLENLPRENGDMVGAVVMIDQRLLCADGFGTHALVADLWPKLLRSYALEAVADASGSDEEWSPRGDNVRAFLRRVDDARIEKEATPGIGLLEDIEGQTISGAALIHDGWPLHVALFPRAGQSRPGGERDNDVPAIQRSYPR